MLIPRLNSKQIDRLSEIYMGIGLISLVSLAIPALIDKLNLTVLLSSLILALLFWIASLNILRK